MKLFVTLSKKTLCIILGLIVIAIVLIGMLSSVKSGERKVSTNAERCEYIKELGYNIDETAISVKEIIIPQSFSDVYTRYNSLQKRAGFDLTPFKGEKATVYTYGINEERVVNIIISDNKVIGGDVSSVKIDGEMLPLERNGNVENTA